MYGSNLNFFPNIELAALYHLLNNLSFPFWLGMSPLCYTRVVCILWPPLNFLVCSIGLSSPAFEPYCFNYCSFYNVFFIIEKSRVPILLFLWKQTSWLISHRLFFQMTTNEVILSNLSQQNEKQNSFCKFDWDDVEFIELDRQSWHLYTTSTS